MHFGGADQAFHVGRGSVAAPGCLPGWLHAHRRLGRVPLDVVLAPARRLADGGVTVNAQQGDLLRILAPILTRTPEAAALVAPGGRLLGAGDRFANPELADFLGRSTSGASPAPGRPAAIDEAMAAGGGLLTAADLDAYRVVERAPLAVAWRGQRLLTNPPPAFGGELVASGLLSWRSRPGWPAEAAHARACGGAGGGDGRHRGGAGGGRRCRRARRRRATGGTTHVSVSRRRRERGQR